MAEDDLDARSEDSTSRRFQFFTLAWVVFILVVLVLCAFRFFPDFEPFNDWASLKRLTYGGVFVGTLLGAIAATKRERDPSESRVKDKFSLVSYALLSVSALVAFLYL